MRILLFPIMACLVMGFSRCNGLSGNNSRTTSVSHARIDSVALRDSLLKDSLMQKEGMRAIGNIDFHISESEFNDQKKIFLDPLAHTSSIGSFSYISGYRLGEYAFSSIDGSFFNDGLYRIRIDGQLISWKDYENEAPRQAMALNEILKAKYGKPVREYPLPSRPAIGSGRILSEWKIGPKEIFSGIIPDDSYYKLILVCYIPEVEELKKAEERRKSRISNTEAASNL